MTASPYLRLPYQCAHGRVPKFCAQCIVPVAVAPVKGAAPVPARKAAPVAPRKVAAAAPFEPGVLTLHVCVCGHTCTTRGAFLVPAWEAPHACKAPR